MPEPARALVSDIKRLTLHDGPGTRSTVFLKGCPLQCLWCHNPELISTTPRLLFHATLCSSCNECTTTCPGAVHSFNQQEHRIDRASCIACGKCTEECLTEALTICGIRRTTQEVFEIVAQDKLFYQTSGGGLTVSGGEPLFHPEFVLELFILAKEEKIHTVLDTCGHVSFKAFEQVLEVTDLILYDLKGMDAAQHQINTGQDNKLILENLEKLGKTSTPLEIRMPIVPGCNDAENEIEKAGAFLKELPNLVKVKLLSYHSMAHGKYRAAGIPDTMPETKPPSPEQMEKLRKILQRYLSVEIIIPK